MNSLFSQCFLEMILTFLGNLFGSLLHGAALVSNMHLYCTFLRGANPILGSASHPTNACSLQECHQLNRLINRLRSGVRFFQDASLQQRNVTPNTSFFTFLCYVYNKYFINWQELK